MPDHDYETREFREYQRQMKAAEHGSPTEKRDACARFIADMRDDPPLVAERVGWLINGSYGYGAHVQARRIVTSPRMNRVAALVQMVGAIEWMCPVRSVVASWKKLSPTEKRNLDAAVKKEIRDAEAEMRLNGGVGAENLKPSKRRTTRKAK